MIILYHKNNRVDSVFDCETQSPIECEEKQIVTVLMQMASSYAERILVWCHSNQKQFLNLEVVKQSLYLKNAMVSFGETAYLPPQIGYVEDSPFIKVNVDVTYPTWQMSSTVGAIYGFQLLKFKNQVAGNTLDYVLSSIAKLGMPNGLFCYSEPQLLIHNNTIRHSGTASHFKLFQFVKQHYKTRWVFLLALNYAWHERRVMLWSLLRSFFYKRKTFNSSIILETSNTKPIAELPSIDVIIPTIGRATYLYDVLKDLALQTHLPKQVIVVEQDPDPQSKTHLDFIDDDTWPFKIIHHFIHQTGACNARNLALKDVLSAYVYLADDDNRFDAHLLEHALTKMMSFQLDVISMSYLQHHEMEQKKQPLQWATFGAGSSILKSDYIKDVSFSMALEFGYGEDVDFGMQLRNLGADVVYVPEIEILHLKAPIGGFRTTFKQPWEQDAIQPKPSPTVMLFHLNHQNKYQTLGYKTLLLIKYYFVQEVKNPIRYYKRFKKQWHQSVYWAKQLQTNNP